jgi:phage tail-like protein
MAEFTVNSKRHDPYKNFKFRVRMNGKTIGGVSEVSSLAEDSSTTAKTKQPGLTKYSNVTLKRGVFKESKYFKLIAAMPGSKKLPVEIVIDLFDEKHKLVASYQLANAWFSKVEGPVLNAKGNEVTIESIEICHEGISPVKL